MITPAFLALAYLFVPPYVQEQRLIVCVAPVYPQLAKAARIEGTVRLAALIDENGEVEELRLISGHPLLVKAAFDAVKHWRYLPAKRGGFPTPVATIVEINFSLRSRRAPLQRFFHHVQGSRPHTHPGIHGNFALFPHQPHS